MADKPRTDTFTSTLDPALSEALDDLERMLGDDDEESPDDLDDDAFGERDADLPLLQPIAPVGPGIDTEDELRDTFGAASHAGLVAGATDAGDAAEPPAGLAFGDEERAALVERVSQRLASELDVIATDCVSQVLSNIEAEVNAQLAARVREHLHIVLPEIIDDLIRQSAN